MSFGNYILFLNTEKLQIARQVLTIYICESEVILRPWDQALVCFVLGNHDRRERMEDFPPWPYMCEEGHIPSHFLLQCDML